MGKLISIIIPVYNVEKYLRQCLDSVFAQTIMDFEVICVDDGSTDSSPQILQEYSLKYSNLIVYTQQNGGMSAARNAGMELATGKYIGFVDSDDFIDPDMYRLMIERAEKDGSQIVVSNPYIYDMKTKKTYVYRNMVDFFHLSQLGAFNPLDNIRIFEYIGPWDKIYETNFLKGNNLKFPLQRIFEDAPFTYQALTLAKSVSVVKDSYYYYRKNAGGSITDKEKTNDNYKYDFLINSREIKDFLKAHNCYKRVAPVFLEYFMRFGSYYHAFATTNKAFKKIFNGMRDLLDDYDLNIITSLGNDKYTWYSKVLSANDKRNCKKHLKEKIL